MSVEIQDNGLRIARFTVEGEPQGKARPRFSRLGGKVATYTPQKTVDYEQKVVRAYKSACGELHFGKKIPLVARITAYFEPPKSVSKAVRAAMCCGEICPTKKPDVDNIAKAICDALNGVAYHDDAQIVVVQVEKRYAVRPRVEVTINEWRYLG